MNRLKLGLILCLSLFFTGCAPKSQMYYWGDYSQTLYDAKKTPGDASLLAHRQTLERIIEESKKVNLPVPPGVYAELGFLYLRENNTKMARQYFQREKELYPEAAMFMERLEQAALARDKKDDDRPVATVQPQMSEENPTK